MDYQRFFEFTPTASYISTPGGVIVGCNKAFLQLFGFWSVEEAQAYGLASLYSDKQILVDFVRRLSVSPIYADQDLRRVDGKPIHVLAGAAGIFDRQQRLVQITGFFLEESQLRASKRGLYEALRMEALTQLAGNIAANFDDLLWIAGDRLAASDSVRLRETVRSASQLRRQLLAFSGMQQLQAAPLSLNDFLKRSGAMIARTISTEEIEIVFDLAGDLGTTMVDQVQLERVILELVANARDAMPLSGRMVFRTENVTVTPNSACLSAHGDSVPPGDYTHGQAYARTGFRSVLQHQVAGPGTGFVSRLRHCQTKQRLYPYRERPGGRNQILDLPASHRARSISPRYSPDCRSR